MQAEHLEPWREHAFVDDRGRTIRLYEDNVLVIFDHHRRREERSKGGIIIPDTARAPGSRAVAVWATVVAAGPGWYPGKRCASCGMPGLTESTVYATCELKPGDRVICEEKDIGDRYMLGGEEHRVIRAGQVLAVSG